MEKLWRVEFIFCDSVIQRRLARHHVLGGSLVLR